MQNKWESVEKSDTDSWLEFVLQVRSNIIETRKKYSICYRFFFYENFKKIWTEDN